MHENFYFERSSTSHNLSMGIVGLPNVGKSTLFNAITKQQVPAHNYPFCTIDPTDGILLIKDERITRLAQIYKPKSIVDAYLQVTDIAGLIKGASEGQGLGNNFLDHIRNVDGIFHVVRCFIDNNVTHCECDIDSIRDIEIIEDELRRKDIENVSKHYERLKKKFRISDINDPRMNQFSKSERAEIIAVNKVSTIIDKRKLLPNDFSSWDEIKIVNKLNLLTTKNVVYLLNISKEDYCNKKGNIHLRNAIKHIKEKDKNAKIIPFSAEYEMEQSLEGKYTDFIKKMVVEGYKALNLINFFTAGSDEVKSWTVRRDTKVPSAGGVIHSDFENYFVQAEVMNYEDLNKMGSENEVKKAGKYCQRGKTYIVEDGDIIYFKSNPPKSIGKKK